MKCVKCGNKTTWDTSYGPADKVVCENCFCKEITKNGSPLKALEVIFNEQKNKKSKKPIDKPKKQ